ncbi:MAG: hypothetical protein BRC58_01500 [Cyanobacteria bacterium QS_8_64_29]|nr:MAG: hypothetical protein BRC58_01500 [Cyanobacteria bacterium QS_8_64_29]
MTSAPLPPDEDGRIEALFAARTLEIPDEHLQPIAEFARTLFGVPMAQVPVMDRQWQWFKAPLGLEGTGCPRDAAFCTYAIANDDTLVVPDTTQDPRFAANPLVVGAPYIRFYAGVPVRWGPDRQIVGTFCIFDYQPRTLDERQRQLLQELAEIAEGTIARFAESAQTQAIDSATGRAGQQRLRQRVQDGIQDLHETGGSLMVAAVGIRGLRELLVVHGASYTNVLLSEVSNRLEQALDAEATIGRWYDDTFLVVQSLTDPQSQLSHEAELVREAFEQPLTVHGESAALSARINVSVHPANAADGEDLVACALQAMQAQAPTGASSVRTYNTDLMAALECRLMQSLDESSGSPPYLVYQPKIAFANGTVIGAEALMRWHDAELGRVSPGEFIPAAESAQAIQPLGRWALREACREAQSWPCCSSGQASTVAVNVAAAQLLEEDFAAAVEEALAATGLAPERLILEVTESTFIEDVGTVIAVMQQVSALGVSFAIDDFGAGYSSFQYLRDLPVHALKIDRTFIQGVDVRPRDRAIVQAIIAVAQELGLTVVAEGVETQQQYRMLAELGCDQMQGFLVAPGLPPAEICPMLATRAIAQGDR